MKNYKNFEVNELSVSELTTVNGGWSIVDVLRELFFEKKDRHPNPGGEEGCLGHN